MDEAGNSIIETKEEFMERALIAVPNKNWMRFRFKVVEGHSWNDGTPFTAEDIKFTLDYIIKHAGALASQAYFLTDYYQSSVIDGDFEFILASNNYTSMKSVCNSLVVLPKHVWQSVRSPAKEKNLNPVGTGAYYIAEGDYIEDSTITVTFRDDYDEKLTKQMFAGEPIKNISLILMSNEDVLINALKDGSIDLMMDTVKPSKAYAVQNNADYEKVEICAVNNEFVSTLLFNVGPYGAFREDAQGKYPGYSKEIRQAISLCIDQQKLIDDVLHGMGVKVGDCLVQDYYAHAYQDADGKYVYHKTDVAAANGTFKIEGDKFIFTDSEGNVTEGKITANDTIVISLKASQMASSPYEVTFTPAAAALTVAAGSYAAEYTKESAMAGTVVYKYSAAVGADNTFSYSVKFAMSGQDMDGASANGTYKIDGDKFIFTDSEGTVTEGKITAENTIVISLKASQMATSPYEVTFTLSK